MRRLHAPHYVASLLLDNRWLSGLFARQINLPMQPISG
jgi:hypothetical protein